VDKRQVKLSKFLSRVLRHRPAAIGLVLDAAGWASTEALIAGANRRGWRLSLAEIEQIVAENDKRRLALSPDKRRIRATHGHSIPVDLGITAAIPPARLFHGTATRYLKPIFQQGLVRGRRQHVHLSEDEETAHRIGARHGVPVVLRVAAAQMHRDGFSFVCSESGIWLTAQVPPRYLVRL
jgi:putative RNA 2'-phosphotransferase